MSKERERLEWLRRSFLSIVMTLFVVIMEMMVLDIHIYGLPGANEPQYIGLGVFILYYLAIVPVAFFTVLYIYNVWVLHFTRNESLRLNGILYLVLVALMSLGYLKLTYWKIPLFSG